MVTGALWSRRSDSNRRLSGYEPDGLTVLPYSATCPLHSAEGDTAITPRGAAITYITRLKHHIPALEAADRDIVRELLAELTAELDAQSWASFGNALACREG